MMTLEQCILAVEQTEGKKQRRRFFLRKRSNEVLTQEQVKAIKTGRKLLRREMRAKGLKDKQDFEVTATSLGLYFDKHRIWLWLAWARSGCGIWSLVGALMLLMGVLFLYALVTQLQGHFTINMSSGMFREGFVLSETKDFANPSTHLFAVPAENVPCISISHIPEYINDIDGQHNETYFAYTFYLRNEGESTVSYEWSLRLNSESKDLTDAVWVMLFEDNMMSFYAKADDAGKAQVLPAFDDNSRGYSFIPTKEFCINPEEQFQVIPGGSRFEYYRIMPYTFATDRVVTEGFRDSIIPMDIHKYTVVIWLEGDDPDCTDDLIGGHVGMELAFRLSGEEDESYEGNGSFSAHWEELLDNLIFWDD